MSGESQASSRRVGWAQKRQRAMQLRLAGATFDQIAEQVGYSDRSNARHAIMGALERLGSEEAAELRDLDLARLDRLLMAVWNQAMNGELAAVDRVLKIVERRARMLGYDSAALTVARGDETTTVEGSTVADMLGDTDETRRSLARVLHDQLPGSA